jgi:hypothetical protein
MSSGNDYTRIGGFTQNQTYDTNLGNDFEDSVQTKFGSFDSTVTTIPTHIDSMKFDNDISTNFKNLDIVHTDSEFDTVSDELDAPQRQPLRNRDVKVRTSTGFFGGAAAGVAGVGIAALSSASFAAKLAFVGGIVGTAIFPGAGTVAGAVIGGLIGALAGGATGAAVGTLLVKGGGWIRSQFSKQQQPITNQNEFTQALDDIKKDHEFGSKTFRDFAMVSDINPKALQPKKEEINRAFEWIMDKLVSDVAFDGRNENLADQLPTEDLADSALVGLMKIFAVPDENVFETADRDENSGRNKIITKFGEFLENNRNADSGTIGAVSDAYANILKSEQLDDDGKDKAVDILAKALANRTSQLTNHGDSLTVEDVNAIADSAYASAEIENRISGQSYGLDDELMDFRSEMLAAAWQSAVAPLVERGQPINNRVVQAVLNPLRQLYEGNVKSSTKENFEDFIFNLGANNLRLDPSVTQLVATRLSELDQIWMGSDENLDVAQDGFCQWVQGRLENRQSVTNEDVAQYFRNHF